MSLYTDEEKSQILEQIEAAASANRLVLDRKDFRPRKSGLLFPVLINLLAVGLIAGAWFGASAYFQTRQKGLELRTDRLFSTESKLLTKVLEDSRKQLEAKNAEIQQIQDQMAALAQEKANLEKSFQSRLAEREKSLRQDMANAVAAERERLTAAGYSQAEVERRIKAFEEQKTLEFTQRLAEYRRAAQQEIEQRSIAVTSLQAQLKASQEATNELRRSIEDQTRQREDALQGQLSSQGAELERLRQDRAETIAFQRATAPAAAEVQDALASGDLGQVKRALANLRQVLAPAAGSANPLVRDRAQADLALTSALANAADSWNQQDQLQSQQKALAVSDQKAKQLATEIDSLRQALSAATASLDSRTAELTTAQAEAATLSQRLEAYKSRAEALVPYKERLETLSALFAQAYTGPRERFETTFGSQEGVQSFPGFDQAWKDLLATPALAAAPAPTPVADQFALYGSVTLVRGNTIVVEALTKASPAVGQEVEIRRVQGKEQTILGRGLVVRSSEGQIELDWTNPSQVPLSGDAAYVVLPSGAGPDKVAP